MVWTVKTLCEDFTVLTVVGIHGLLVTERTTVRREAVSA